MSIGNDKSGNQGNNFPFQKKVLKGVQELVNSNDINTLKAISKMLGSSVRTPDILTVGPNYTASVRAGYRSVAIANIGSTDALVNAQVLQSGVTINFDAGGLDDTLSEINIASQLSSLIITTVL
jgi:hypothetical protein